MSYIGWAWLAIVVVCIVIEGLTLGLTTIWFAVGALAAWITYAIGIRLEGQIVVFLAVAIICLIFTRPIAVKKLKIGKTKTNAESLIGEETKVVSEINNINNEGSVKIRGQMWSAKSLDNVIIEKDTIVVIEEIKGVKLVVRKKQI